MGSIFILLGEEKFEWFWRTQTHERVVRVETEGRSRWCHERNDIRARSLGLVRDCRRIADPGSSRRNAAPGRPVTSPATTIPPTTHSHRALADRTKAQGSSPKHSSEYRYYSARRSLPCGLHLTPINYMLLLSFRWDKIIREFWRIKIIVIIIIDLWIFFRKCFPCENQRHDHQRLRLNGTICHRKCHENLRETEKKLPRPVFYEASNVPLR